MLLAQHLADRLTPEPVFVSVDELDYRAVAGLAPALFTTLTGRSDRRRGLALLAVVGWVERREEREVSYLTVLTASRRSPVEFDDALRSLRHAELPARSAPR